MSRPLFDLIYRSSNVTLEGAPSWFDQANRSSREDWTNVRSTLESWYSRRPDSTGDLRARLRKNDQNRHSAYFELFLQELFVKAGLNVTVEPRLESGSTPDFLIRGAGGCRVYVEATVVEGDRDNVHEQDVIDAINALQGEVPDDVGVWAEAYGSLLKPMSRRDVKRRVMPWLNGLEASALSSFVTRDGPKLTVASRERTGGWSLIVHAMRRTMGPVVQWSHSDVHYFGKSIHEALVAKARQHRGANYPVVLAVNDINRHFDEEYIFSGFWKACPRIGAVLLFDHCVPWSCADGWAVHVEMNPEYGDRLPTELLALAAPSGPSIRELVGLPSGWPDPKRAGRRQWIADLFD